jgi:hypothetical protein
MVRARGVASTVTHTTVAEWQTSAWHCQQLQASIQGVQSSRDPIHPPPPEYHGIASTGPHTLAWALGADDPRAFDRATFRTMRPLALASSSCDCRGSALSSIGMPIHAVNSRKQDGVVSKVTPTSALRRPRARAPNSVAIHPQTFSAESDSTLTPTSALGGHRARLRSALGNPHPPPHESRRVAYSAWPTCAALAAGERVERALGTHHAPSITRLRGVASAVRGRGPSGPPSATPDSVRSIPLHPSAVEAHHPYAMGPSGGGWALVRNSLGSHPPARAVRSHIRGQAHVGPSRTAECASGTPFGCVRRRPPSTSD